MYESVDKQMLTKNSSFIKESGHELPTKNNDATAETPAVHKRNADNFSTEKQSKTISQGSPRQNLESEDVHFDYSFDQVPLYLLSVSPNRFSFSADLGEASDLPERALTGEFSGLPKTFPAKASKNPKRPAESSKLNKKPLFIKNCNFIQNEKKLQKLFYEINPNIKLSKTTFYSLGNIKLLPKTTNDYQLINHYAFSSAIYRLTNKHITIEESANTFHNSTFCNKKVSITATLEDIEFGCPN